MGGTYTEAQARATRAYEEKTYKAVIFKFKRDEDADILEALEAAKENGFTKMEWMRELFEGPAKVEKALAKYGVQPNIIARIMQEL